MRNLIPNDEVHLLNEDLDESLALPSSRSDQKKVSKVPQLIVPRERAVSCEGKLALLITDESTAASECIEIELSDPFGIETQIKSL